MVERYAAHPPMFKNHPLGFILTLVLVPAFGLGLIIFLVWYLRAKSYRLVVTDKEILFEEGLLNKSRSELNISGIRSVRVNQSLSDRIFGVGTVEIFTAGDRPEITAHGMPDPNSVRDYIKAT